MPKKGMPTTYWWKELRLPFNNWSVQAILENRKTQVRLPALRKLAYPDGSWLVIRRGGSTMIFPNETAALQTMAGWCLSSSGSLLHVQEAYRIEGEEADGYDSIYTIRFRADNSLTQTRTDKGTLDKCWTTAGVWARAVSLPFAAIRIHLVVDNVRVERLQDISDEDLRAEGIKPEVYGTGIYREHYYRPAYEKQCDIDHYQQPGPFWADNPWVLVTTFHRREESDAQVQ